MTPLHDLILIIDDAIGDLHAQAEQSSHPQFAAIDTFYAAWKVLKRILEGER